MSRTSCRGWACPRTYRGFEATIAAVWLVLEDEDCLRMVTTRIYAKVAQLSGQTRHAAERNIRTVVKRAWTAIRPICRRSPGTRSAPSRSRPSLLICWPRTRCGSRPRGQIPT